jgi:hypothetical protein
MRLASEGRNGWVDFGVFLVLGGLVVWAFATFSGTGTNARKVGGGASPASVVVNLPDKMIVVEATDVPTQPVGSPTPTPGPCSYDLGMDDLCYWQGEVPPTSTPLVPPCWEGSATPGAACERIPIPPTPTPTEICVGSYGVGNCIWPGTPAAGK